MVSYAFTGMLWDKSPQWMSDTQLWGLTHHNCKKKFINTKNNKKGSWRMCKKVWSKRHKLFKKYVKAFKYCFVVWITNCDSMGFSKNMILYQPTPLSLMSRMWRVKILAYPRLPFSPFDDVTFNPDPHTHLALLNQDPFF